MVTANPKMIATAVTRCRKKYINKHIVLKDTEKIT